MPLGAVVLSFSALAFTPSTPEHALALILRAVARDGVAWQTTPRQVATDGGDVAPRVAKDQHALRRHGRRRFDRRRRRIRHRGPAQLDSLLLCLGELDWSLNWSLGSLGGAYRGHLRVREERPSATAQSQRGVGCTRPG